MSKVGFGGYRVSSRSDEHKDALKKAIDEGVTLIDTSANYTDGESEKLIGEVLKESEKKPFLISKVGYIQGSNLEVIEELNTKGLATEDLVTLDKTLKHSIHPDFIEDQIKRSLERLGVESIDCYLLHNPEYYLKSEESSKEEYYKRIKKAFDKMEDLVDRGLIHSYGISSNTFVDPKEDHESTDLDIVVGAARSVRKNHHFRYIQFPMNILEMGALERQYEGDHLIERAQTFGLKTIINRPLNCFSEQGLLRLATYPVAEEYKTKENTDKIFNQCIEPLVVKWLTVREDDGDKLFDIPLMKQVSEIWHKQNSLDAVDQVFMGYFFPLIANIWGGDLSPKESQSFYDLYDHAREFAKQNMNERANQFEEQAIDKGLLFESDLKLCQKVIEKYQSFGVDYILVGMRKSEYVDDFKNYF
jgi:aryl-alcohol dehydrogenase-like predicted oxidoreductase